MKALIVGEEGGLVSDIGRALRMRWPDVELADTNSTQGLRLLIADDPADVIFVSTALTDVDALALVGEIRKASDTVIILVGRGHDDMDSVEALEAGCDDYLFTPIRESLLVAKVDSALRRARKIGAAQQQAVTCGDLAIDPEAHEARINGRHLYLTPTEFKLLYHLAVNDGRLVTQRAMESLIWGRSDNVYITVLRKHVQRLRRKLESHRGSRTTIATVPWVGYKLVHSNSSPSKR